MAYIAPRSCFFHRWIETNLTVMINPTNHCQLTSHSTSQHPALFLYVCQINELKNIRLYPFLYLFGLCICKQNMQELATSSMPSSSEKSSSSALQLEVKEGQILLATAFAQISFKVFNF